MIKRMEQAAKIEERRRRVGELVVKARKERRLSALRACKAAGISRGAWGNVEDGARAQELSYTAAEQLFDWEIGSIERYIDGDGPEPGPAPSTSVITDDPTKRDLVDAVERFETPESRRQVLTFLDALYATVHDKDVTE